LQITITILPLLNFSSRNIHACRQGGFNSARQLTSAESLPTLRHIDFS
jgi:hypothetical protein